MVKVSPAGERDPLALGTLTTGSAVHLPGLSFLICQTGGLAEICPVQHSKYQRRAALYTEIKM